MTEFFTYSRMWSDVAAVAAWLLLWSTAVSCLVVSPLSHRRRFFVFLCTVLASASLGFVTGQITGQSRTAAVGAVLPGVLGLVGAVMVYTLGTQGVRHQLIASLFTISLAMNLLIGATWGAKKRHNVELFKLATEENAKLIAAKRRLLNESKFRKQKREFETQLKERFEADIRQFWENEEARPEQ